MLHVESFKISGCAILLQPAQSQQPEKIMTEVQKQDAKTEALKANLEGNESIMDRVMEELKETKRKVEFFRGIEEIVKLRIDGAILSNHIIH